MPKLINPEEKYNFYKNYIKNEGCELLTSIDAFKENVLKARKNNTWTSYNEIKLKIKCKVCLKEFTTNFSNFKKSLKMCSRCSKENRRTKLLSFEELERRIKSKGLLFISGDYKGETSKLKVACSCGNEFETTYASIRNSSENILCEECIKLSMRIKFKLDFKTVQEEFKKKECVLLSAEEEYENAHSKLKYIAKCGHINYNTFDSFKRNKHCLCKECLKEITKGANNYNWKGGYDSEKIAFRKTYEFKKWQRDVFVRDDFTCQCCNKRGYKINAHHLDGYNWCKEKRTDINNGITLCENCHNDFHNIYGRGNNTKEQFEKYINSIKEMKKLS